MRDGYLDLCPDFEEKLTPIQFLCESAPMIAIYDTIWRPLGYRFTSERSFPEDLDRITALMDPARHSRILDLGCGPGNFTRSIAGHGPHVVGFDLAPRMLKRAVALTPASAYPNVTYIRGNALEMPFEAGAFDAVICCAALHLMSDYERVLAEVSRVLRPGGEFMCQTIATPGRAPLWLRLSDRVMHYGYFETAQLKSQLIDLGLKIVVEEPSSVSYIFRAAKTIGSPEMAARAR